MLFAVNWKAVVFLCVFYAPQIIFRLNFYQYFIRPLRLNCYLCNTVRLAVMALP